MAAGNLTLVSTRANYKAPMKRLPKTKKVRKSKVSKAIKQEIKKELRREIENKEAFLLHPSTLGTYTSFNNSIGISDFVDVMPAIPQGDGSGFRTGNQIRLTGLYVKGHISMLISNLPQTIITGGNIYVRLLCLEDRESLGVGITTSDILTRGGNNATFQGYPQDVYTSIDKSRFIVHYDKIIKLHASNYPANTPNGYNANQMTSAQFGFKIKGKKIAYESNGDTRPTKFSPQFAVAFVDPTMTGSAGTPSSFFSACQYSFESQVYYEDA